MMMPQPIAMPSAVVHITGRVDSWLYSKEKLILQLLLYNIAVIVCDI